MRSSSDDETETGSIAALVALESRDAISPAGTSSARTASMLSYPNPGRSSIDPSTRRGGSCSVEREFGVEQDERFARPGSAEQPLRIQAAVSRQCTGEITADAVRGFAKKAQLGADQRGQRLRQGVQLRGAGMMLGE